MAMTNGIGRRRGVRLFMLGAMGYGSRRDAGGTGKKEKNALATDTSQEIFSHVPIL